MTNNIYTTTNTTILLFNFFLFTISQIIATGNTSAHSYTALDISLSPNAAHTDWPVAWAYIRQVPPN